MREWQKITTASNGIEQKRLGDVATFIDYRGKTPHKTPFGVPLITAKIVKNGSILPANEYISNDEYNAWMTRGLPQKGDVVLTTEAPMGEVAQLRDEHVALAQRIITIRGKEGILDNAYLKYFLQSPSGQIRLKARETGTTVTGIKSAELQEIAIPIPKIDTQKKIAQILLSIDDKIELNTRINQNLEAQAKLLLEGNISLTQSIKFSDILSFANGFAFKSSTYVNDGKYKVITIKNVQDGKIDSCGADSVLELPQKINPECILSIGDVLLSLTGNVGRTGIVFEENLLLNQRVAKIIPRYQALKAPEYFIFRLNSIKSILEKMSRGTAQANLSPVETLNIDIPFEIQTLDMLSNCLNSFFYQIINNNQKSQKLAQLRDTLLPKLMSGEIDVSQVEV